MTATTVTKRRYYAYPLATLIVAGVCAHALHHWLYARPVQPLAISLREFPKQMGPWHIQQEGLDADVEEVLRLQDHWSGSYSDGRGGVASLFIGYYADESIAKDHQPTICYPAAGWLLMSTDRCQLELGSKPGATLKMNRLQVRRGAQSQLVLYWFQLPDATVADPMMSKISRLKRIFSGRFSRSLVKVQIGLPVTDSVEAATERARPFIALVLKNLGVCLGPGWAVPQADMVAEGGS